MLQTFVQGMTIFKREKTSRVSSSSAQSSQPQYGYSQETPPSERRIDCPTSTIVSTSSDIYYSIRRSTNSMPTQLLITLTIINTDTIQKAREIRPLARRHLTPPMSPLAASSPALHALGLFDPAILRRLGPRKVINARLVEGWRRAMGLGYRGNGWHTIHRVCG
jgi:hypothetical protein